MPDTTDKIKEANKLNLQKQQLLNTNSNNNESQNGYTPPYKPSPSIAKYDIKTGEFAENYDWDTHEWLYGDQQPSKEETQAWSRQMVKFKMLNKLWKYLLPSFGLVLIPLSWWVLKKNFLGDVSYPPFACRIFPKSLTFMGPEPPPTGSEKLLAWIIFIGGWIAVFFLAVSILMFLGFLTIFPLLAVKFAWDFVCQAILNIGEKLWNMLF
jgi:hypothetical protein